MVTSNMRWSWNCFILLWTGSPFQVNVACRDLQPVLEAQGSLLPPPSGAQGVAALLLQTTYTCCRSTSDSSNAASAGETASDAAPGSSGSGLRYALLAASFRALAALSGSLPGLCDGACLVPVLQSGGSCRCQALLG